MEGDMCTLTFRPTRGCICMFKMRFLLSMAILWLSSVTVHGISLFSITPGNPSLNSHIAQNFFEALLSNGALHAPPPQLSPHGSPNASPSPSPSINRKPPRPLNHPSAAHHYLPMAAKSNGLNSGQRTGLVLLAVAGLLQIVVVTYLVFKRKQMLQVVEKYEV